MLYDGEDDDRVWSRRQIADKVRRNRRDEGRDDAPLVDDQGIADIVSELCQNGTLRSAVGGQAAKIGRAFDGPRANVRYYGLADVVQRRRAKANEKDMLRKRAKQSAAEVRKILGTDVTEVGVTTNGMVNIVLTPEQVPALLDKLRSTQLPQVLPNPSPPFL